ncbi:hypothetical protein AURANDRAFT_70896 [Aureococcus anophagefferens]|uniref:Sulfotransferase domain-containing protein n=1 Tax=Aureococcus anophagefferens TaxID=44056 RepID=F0XZN9_AURAN|nr:hypothetical protein AURANDRAFT_70896 [Aureococcus anophagefferens]EGB11378.1 hypothetical protein AURANDRAFT_70896 [Aureococcus anophagefferens]|eukprot:XP_009033752.1 hypothetical protein AURANDRAFT_70896 [Aureococcus anophagefferens]
MQWLWLLVAARVADARFANRTVVVDRGAFPHLAIVGSDKGGTSDAFVAIVKHGDWAAKYTVDCDTIRVKKLGDRARDKCRQKSKELGCLYRGGTLESWRRCYSGYVPDNMKKGITDKLWMDATPNYLWGWCRGTDAASRLFELSPRTVVVALLREPMDRLRSLFNYWSTEPIGLEIATTLEPHVLLDLAYLEKPWATPVTRTTASETLSAERLFEEGGRDVYELYQKNYVIWAGGQPREVCAGVLGPKQRRGPWGRGEMRERCPVFTNLILTGLYYTFLRHWIRLFPEQVIVVQSEYYFQDRRVLLSLLGRGAPAPAIDGPPASSHAKKVANRGHYVYGNATLTNETHARLEAFYARPNALLRTLLADEARAGRILVSPDPAVPGSWWT